LENDINILEIKVPGYERFLSQTERDVVAEVLDLENQHNNGYSKSEAKLLLQRTVIAKAEEDLKQGIELDYRLNKMSNFKSSSAYVNSYWW
jgi:hypothetical protein